MDINLPKMPLPDHGFWDFEGDWCARNAYEPETVKAYARSAVLADRERKKVEWEELNDLLRRLRDHVATDVETECESEPEFSKYARELLEEINTVLEIRK